MNKITSLFIVIFGLYHIIFIFLFFSPLLFDIWPNASVENLSAVLKQGSLVFGILAGMLLYFDNGRIKTSKRYALWILLGISIALFVWTLFIPRMLSNNIPQPTGF